MNVKITKLKGGKIPDNFWVEGNGDYPISGQQYFVKSVTNTSARKLANVPMNWFQVAPIMKIVKTSYGRLFIAGQALWTWREKA